MKIICVLLYVFAVHDLYATFSSFGQIITEVGRLENMISSLESNNRSAHQHVPQQYYIPQTRQQVNQQYAQSSRQYPVERNFAKRQPLTGIQLAQQFLYRNNMVGANNIKAAGISSDGNRVAYFASENGFERIIIERKLQGKDVIESIVYTYRDNNGFIRSRAVKLSNNMSIEIPSIRNARSIKLTCGPNVNYVVATSYDGRTYQVYKVSINNFMVERINPPISRKQTFVR